MALVMSFIVKRDSEVIDYEDAFGKMNTVDDFSLRGSILAYMCTFLVCYFCAASHGVIKNDRGRVDCRMAKAC